jgi:hypothetical protein
MPIPFFPGAKSDTPSAADLQRRLEQKDTELADARNRVRQLEAAWTPAPPKPRRSAASAKPPDRS